MENPSKKLRKASKLHKSKICDKKLKKLFYRAKRSKKVRNK